MQRIITVTFHRAHNYGAVLQAYALQKFLENNFKFETFCLDYYPEYLKAKIFEIKKSENILLSILRNIITSYSRIKRKKKFDDFIENKIKIIKYNKSNTEDNNIYIVGSDQIWNEDITDNKLDPVYFLDFTKSKHKYSYAASIGKNNADYLAIINKLKNFKYVGVREEKSKLILTANGYKNVIHTIDPVFLLEKQEYEKISIYPSFKDYILIYTLETTDKVRKKITLLKKTHHGIKTVSIGTFKNIYNTDKHYSSIGPEEYLGLIQNARFIITNSFHAIAFGIIFQKNLIYIPLKNGRGERIENLLKIAGLKFENYEKNPFKNELLFHIFKSKQYLKEIIKKSSIEGKE